MTVAVQHRPASPSSSADGARVPCIVVGGGIAGLAAAYFLKRAGIEVLALERSARAGGVIDSTEEGGFLFERGPNTVLDKLPVVDELIDALGLRAESIRVPLSEHPRYIWHGGRLREVPSGPGSLLSSSLFSFGGKLRLLREPFIPPIEADEPLKDFIIRRLGQEVYDRAFLPMVQGLGAGDPARLSVAASFPILKEFERGAGSVIKGFMRKMKEEARRRKAAGEPRRAVSMISFRSGLRRLPQALAVALGESFQPNAEVRAIAASPDGGFQISGALCGEPHNWRAERVILCSTASSAASSIESLEPEAARRLNAVHYSPLAAVGLGVEASSIRIPPGFGFLAARGQGLRILGAIFASNIFAGRAPAGCASLAVMIGGDLDPEAAALDDSKIAELLRADLKLALGWNGQAKALRIERYPRAIPQYTMDHPALAAALREAEARRPGLHFLGNWIGGTSMPDCMNNAKNLAARIAAARKAEATQPTR